MNYCSIAIYLYGDLIDLGEASKLLGLQPTKARMRGEERQTSSGTRVVQKISFWEHRLRVELKDVSSSISQLIDQIDCANIVGIAGIERAELDVYIPIEPNSPMEMICVELPSKLLLRIAEIGLYLQVTAE